MELKSLKKEHKKLATTTKKATKKRLNDLYVKHCGKDLKTVEDAMERDNYMNPDQALEFGLIDKIVEKR